MSLEFCSLTDFSFYFTFRLLDNRFVYPCLVRNKCHVIVTLQTLYSLIP